MSDAVIIDVIRTPMGRGKPAGALAGIHPVDLLSQVLVSLVGRTGIDPADVDDILIGCVSQVGEQSATPGRYAWLGAGYPAHVPSTTIERKCGSGQQAAEFANSSIIAGNYDLAIAGGVESMSRVPMGSGRLGQDPFGLAANERYPKLVPQGIAAERIAAKWKITREQQDAFSAASHQRAAETARSGGFDDEIVAITLPDGTLVSADETIRPDTTPERLAALKPAFAAEPYLSEYPELNWSVTAGNSSQITDGAAALLLASTDRATELGLTPRARIVASAVVGDDPEMMLTGPIPATHKVLKRSGLSISDLNVIEINEAFAPVPLAWQAEFGADPEKVNPRGGAIALGHPLGASGARLLGTLINHLEQTDGRYGLLTMCEAGGMANATIIERI